MSKGVYIIFFFLVPKSFQIAKGNFSYPYVVNSFYVRPYKIIYFLIFTLMFHANEDLQMSKNQNLILFSYN